MTAEKYVNAVVHRVKCTRNKRREIRQQLLSDISAAKENGERTETILERMGSVQALASEFNENLPELERKKFKRRKLICILGIIVLVLMILILMIWWFLPKVSKLGASGKFQEEVADARTKEVIQNLNDNDFTALHESCNEAMKRALTPEVLESVKAKISDEWGDFQFYGKIYMYEMIQQGKLFAVVQVAAVYENVTVTYTISFDEDMKLAGLYLK